MALTRRLVKGQALNGAEHDANVDYFEQNPNGVMIPKAANVGIKIDEAAPDWGWHDIIGNIHYDESAVATLPDYTLYNGNIKDRQFDVGDEGFIKLHIPHDYAIGTDLFIHLHWSHNALGVTSGAPTFIVEGTYAKGHNQAAFGTPTSVSISENASTTQYQHMITEEQLSNNGGTGGLIDTNLIEPDGLLLLRIILSTNTISGGVKPFVHFCDVHYQSTDVPTKQRTPNFYV